MTFRAPVRDLALALKCAGHDALIARAYPDLDADTVQAVLEAAAAFTENELAPLNRIGDRLSEHSPFETVFQRPDTEGTRCRSAILMWECERACKNVLF